MKKVFAVLMCVCLLAVGVCASAEGEDYLSTIQGSYVELFPELAKEEYHQTWADAVTPLVGAENADATVAALLDGCMADIYGADAAAAYEADPASTRFDCYFLGGMVKMTVDGNRISGVDADGNEVFSHEYTLQDIANENGFIFYKTDDADAGMFTWFAFSPDTMATTYHLEFRYAEDESDLESWFTGNYCYWNAAGIAENYTEEEITACIELFATENLAVADDAA